MHESLRPETNRKIVAVWLVGVAAIWIFAPDRLSLLAFVLGASAGLAAGVLQRTALSEQRASFLATRSVMDVRRALTSSRAGKASLATQWITFAALAVICLRDIETLPSLFLGFFAFKLARDITAYTAVVALQGTVMPD